MLVALCDKSPHSFNIMRFVRDVRQERCQAVTEPAECIYIYYVLTASSLTLVGRESHTEYALVRVVALLNPLPVIHACFRAGKWTQEENDTGNTVFLLGTGPRKKMLLVTAVALFLSGERAVSGNCLFPPGVGTV